MILGKRKKQEELRKQKELEQKRIEEEKLREEKLRQEMEAERKRAEEEAARIVPYKFSVPDPKPKELISVLTNMLKKLFPEAKKAYLVLTELNEKKGYLLVVDIDAKFYKIIQLYLDGETKKVRDGLPIECILYSKSGSLTEKMEPFYQKVVSESEKKIQEDAKKANSEISFCDMPEFGIQDNLTDEFVVPGDENIKSESDDNVQAENVGDSAVVFEEAADADSEVLEDTAEEIPADLSKESEVEPLSEDVADASQPDEANQEDEELQGESVCEETAEADDANEAETAVSDDSADKEPPKVIPETKIQLFAMMNRIGDDASSDSLDIARDGFSEFKFYIPCIAMQNNDIIRDSFDAQDKPFILINRNTGIRAIVFFTDEEDAVEFARKSECGLVHAKYKDYKTAFSDGTLVNVAAEGIVINPTKEQILLAPDYCLL